MDDESRGYTTSGDIDDGDPTAMEKKEKKDVADADPDADPDGRKKDVKKDVTTTKDGATTISPQGIDFIKSFEKFRATKYDATGRGDWTIGWGHSIRSGENWDNGITRETADKLLVNDLQEVMTAINKYVTVALSQQQFDALTSYVYNAGAGNTLIGTQLISALNSKDYDGAVKQFDIIKAGGVVSSGLITRRAAEQKIWSEKTYENH